ncbi:MAG: glycoside hydrolase family 53 protein [Microbacter sp.]
MFLKNYKLAHWSLFLVVITIGALCLTIIGCSKANIPTAPLAVATTMIQGVDISFLPQVEEAGIVLYNLAGQPEDMLSTLKNAGCNTVRVRLWYAPADGHSGFNEVSRFLSQIKAKGMKVWLDIHYSDTWADPGHQTPPAAWQHCSFAALKDSVYAYTKRMMELLQPDDVQIGNEINGGFLWPEGSIDSLSNFKALLSSGIKAVRDVNANTKIIIHYAGLAGADWFFGQLTGLDYDMIGISYYPVWHGTDLNLLQSTLATLGLKYQKRVVIAETAYPFTLSWNDETPNVVGEASQLVPGYPASPQGQLDFMVKIKDISTSFAAGAGFCYWGAADIAFKGPTATNGSNWENQAFYDFSNHALPVLNVFNHS